MRDDTQASAAMSEDPVFQGEGSPVALTTTDRLLEHLGLAGATTGRRRRASRSGDLPRPPATVPA